MKTSLRSPAPNPSLRSTSILLGALVTAAACGPTDEISSVARQLTAMESARPFAVPDQALLAHTGEPLNLRDATDGRFALLFFGYTYCPDICPIQMATANAAMAQLTPEERARVVQLFVTVDPQRDSPERLAEWIQGMRSPAVGLRGSTSELEALLGAMGFVMPPMTSRQQIEGAGPDAYLVPHPTSLFLITPDGMGRFQYRYEGTTPAQIVADLRLLMELPWNDMTPAPQAAAEDAGSGALPGEESEEGARSAAGTGAVAGLVVRDAKIPAGNPRARSLAVYAEIENAGPDDVLVGLLADIAEVAMVHRMEMRDGLSSMHPAGDVPLPSGGAISLRTGALHGMLSELARVPEAGETVNVTFVFASGVEVVVEVPVVSLEEMVPGGTSEPR